MAIRRTRTQKEQARLRQEKSLTYQYSAVSLSPSPSVTSPKTNQPSLTDRKLKQLLMNDPKYITQDLRKTALVTVAVLVILSMITILNFR